MIAAALTLCLAASPGLKVSAKPPPVLVMVRTEAKGSFDRTQQRLFDELSLLLDSFMVMSSPLEERDFPRRSLADQISAVMPVAKANDAVAVVWLAEPSPGQLMLHLVALGTGRTLVRTIDFDRKSGSEAALALMLRELLGTAFLYSPTAPPEVRQVVNQVRQTFTLPELQPVTAADRAVKPVVEKKREWSFGAAGTIEAGVGDSRGPSSRLGLAVWGAWHEWLSAELSFAIQRARLGTGVFTSTSLPALVFASYPFKISDFGLSPRVGAGVELDWLFTALTSPKQFFGATPIGVLGLEASQGLGALRLLVCVDVFGRVIRPEVVDTVDGAVVWRLPAVSARVSIGVRWEGF